MSKIHRRDAMKLTALGIGGALAAPAASPAGWAVKTASDPFGGLRCGVTSYTTRKLSLDQTIAALQRLGIKYISLKSMHLPLESSLDERQAVAKKVADAGLTLMGCGVITLKNDENEIRNAFQYCQDVGAPVAVIMPHRDALGTLDKVIKDFKDLRAAIHNHGPEDKQFPSPTGVFEAIKDLDTRIGCCVDVGHTFRLQEDPMAALRKVRSRLYDVHLKDVSATGEEPPKVPYGRGVMNCAGILRTLADLNFSGHTALEWEGEEDDPIPGIAESFGFIRGHFAKG